MTAPASPIDPASCPADVPHMIQFEDDDWHITADVPQYRAHRCTNGHWHLHSTDRWDYDDDEVIVLRRADADDELVVLPRSDA